MFMNYELRVELWLNSTCLSTVLRLEIITGINYAFYKLCSYCNVWYISEVFFNLNLYSTYEPGQQSGEIGFCLDSLSNVE